MTKEKLLMNFISSIIFIFYGVFLICSQLFSLQNIRIYFIIFFLLYGILKGITWIYQKDFTLLFDTFTGLSLGFISIVWDLFQTPKEIAFLILTFALLLSLIKLKKADIFHDHKNKNWQIEIMELIFFLCFSILFCLNLSVPEKEMFLNLGFYAFFIGVLDFHKTFFYHILKGQLK